MKNETKAEPQAKAAHTPGNWVASCGQDFAVVLAPDSRIQPVAVCHNIYGSVEETIDEDKANARLIAAAPDLLAALRELADSTEAYTDAQDEGGHPEAHVDRMILARRSARAAIARAEGRTP